MFVSHRLEEAFELCDRVTVLRDGATVAEAEIAATSPGEVVRWMVGRELTELFPKVPSVPGEVLLDVAGLTRPGVFENITFSVRRGEIVALAGLVCSGRSEVVRAVFGIDRYESGAVRISGKPLPPADPRAALARRVALVPEDRRAQGLFMPASIARNSSVVVLDRLRRFGLVRPGAERAMARNWADRLRLKYSDVDQPVERLSGGNQQKVVLAKWLATDPELLVIDEPTRGIDIGTKAEVHRLLSERAAEGLAVLMVSSDLLEVLGMADRVLVEVVREGRVDSIGVDSWSVDYGLLDASGQLTGNPVHYRDERTTGVMERMTASLGAAEIYATTGIQFLPFNTLYQLVAEAVTGQRILLMPDLIAYWLTGEQGAELTNASTTQLLDIHTRTWATDLIRRAGLDPALLPPLREPGTRIGDAGSVPVIAVA